MDPTLQKHGAKHIYKVPEGLRELCSDISREVLRSQPTNILAFIAEYVDTLLITRENTKSTFFVLRNISEISSSASPCFLKKKKKYSRERVIKFAPSSQLQSKS
ncbi:uncharacterized protein LOC122719174 [Apis laboriosa]|uniref:uncharacterized protein LOC122719174 n=1 Tax=Apis laboriosa TaxID=183418 RepID=UPI001CC4FBAA|nr:uncharacterized protein LOC122719174 [Apis laboriosa]